MKKKIKNPKMTPMMRQYYEIKNRHPDKYLFFRLGDFYEMFDQDAVEISTMLQITLTERHQIPMCGIPHHQLHRYAHKVIAQGKKIVVVEQEKLEPGSSLFSRKIAQVITPGTTIDEMNLTAQEKNFIISFYFPGEDNLFTGMDNLWNNSNSAGIIALETTTGEVIFENIVEKRDLMRSLKRFFESYFPMEVVLSENYRDNNLVKILTRDYPHLIINYAFDPASDLVKEKINLVYSKSSVKVGNINTDSLYYFHYRGLYLLLIYAEENYGEPITYLQPPRIMEPQLFLTLDQQTFIHLEIFKNNFDHSRKYSLLSIIDYTRTMMGARKLQEYLAFPSRDRKAINSRLNNTEFFFKNPILLKEIRGWMSHIMDIERISIRLALKRVFPRDFISLKLSITVVNKLLNTLNEKNPSMTESLIGTLPSMGNFSEFFTSGKSNATIIMERLNDIAIKIEDTIHDKPNNDINKGDFIKPDAHPRLKEYFTIKTQAERLLTELEVRERKKTGISNLKIKYNDNLGYFFETGKSGGINVPAHFVRKQSLVSAERFVSEELLKLDSEIRETRDNSIELEKKIFERLREEVEKYVSLFQKISYFIAQVDIFAGFAELANTCRWTRPMITESGTLNVKGGRHPVVEAETDDPFIPNDISIGSKKDTVQIITGPNMSGKSTFLRQNAIIVILAHLGSFVPATYAEVPLCDQVFTRIGSGDRLFQGESTFLVEMQETAHILKQMTSKSLVIMDEIGRGTSTYDGLALAWSVLEYINHDPDKRAKTLFATHYHELISLTREEGITHYHVTIREEGDQIVFLKKVVKGITSRSYGIQVARLAGLPEKVVNHAQSLLKALEAKQEQIDADNLNRQVKEGKIKLSCVEQQVFPWVKDILDFDISIHSPLETSQFLHGLQQKIKDKMTSDHSSN